MVVEKEVGESEANDMNIRPGLSEMTSMTSNATLPVIQAMNTFPRPVVKHDAGALVFFLRSCIWDQINHTNSFLYW
jgi:hypothetical protein